ncbi:hypothetical protein OSTOST_05933, partial [Ostertagia ostertagi]
MCFGITNERLEKAKHRMSVLMRKAQPSLYDRLRWSGTLSSMHLVMNFADIRFTRGVAREIALAQSLDWPMSHKWVKTNEEKNQMNGSFGTGYKLTLSSPHQKTGVTKVKPFSGTLGVMTAVDTKEGQEPPPRKSFFRKYFLEGCMAHPEKKSMIPANTWEESSTPVVVVEESATQEVPPDADFIERFLVLNRKYIAFIFPIIVMQTLWWLTAVRYDWLSLYETRMANAADYDFGSSCR